MLVAYTAIDTSITEVQFDNLKNDIPGHLLERNSQLRRYQDRLRNLLGLLLLTTCWSKHFGVSLNLEQIKSTELGRPYLAEAQADFNIAHSGEYVVCVLSPDHRVGIDIEYKRELSLADFKRTMNSDQWKEIHASDDPTGLFLKFWSIKESVIKADGRGLSIPLTDIIFNDNQVRYDNVLWFLKSFQLGAEHFGCVAANGAIKPLDLHFIPWSDLKVNQNKPRQV